VAITTQTTDASTGQADGVTVTWAAVPNGNQGDAHGGPYITASFSVTGTFGVGGSVRLEGSEDGTNWFALSPAALTSAGLFAALGLTEHPKFIRPNVTAGDGTTALTVVGFFASPRRVN
jgi:hypothetical protein